MFLRAIIYSFVVRNEMVGQRGLTPNYHANCPHIPSGRHVCIWTNSIYIYPFLLHMYIHTTVHFKINMALKELDYLSERRDRVCFDQA